MKKTKNPLNVKSRIRLIDGKIMARTSQPTLKKQKMFVNIKL